MKKAQFLVVISIFCFASCEYGSSDVNGPSPTIDLKIPEKFEGYYLDNGFVTPKGTIAKVSSDGSTMNYKYRKGVFFVRIDQSGEVQMSSGDTYTCTSTCSSGCDVVMLGDNVGCSACPRTETAECNGKWEGGDQSQQHLVPKGFIDFEEGISIISDRTIFDKKEMLPVPSWSIMSQIEEVNEIVNSFHKEMWEGYDINVDESQNVFVNFFGNVATIKIPLNSKARVDAIDGGGVSCDCSGSSSGCDYEVIKTDTFIPVLIGHKCVRNGCTSCSMTLPPNDE